MNRTPSSAHTTTRTSHTTRTTRPIHRRIAVGLLTVFATAGSAIGCQAGNPPPKTVVPSKAAPSSSSSPSPPLPPDFPDSPKALGEKDGAVPDGTTVFDDIPAVAKLRPDLLNAIRRAAKNAAVDGISLYVNSGWRSPEYQAQLLRKAVSEYGSEAEAARWVATADTSPHVSRDAVDIGRSDAAEWLAEHGAAYGLCRIYRNEPWHYELRPEAAGSGCPPMYADPTQDPRMQR